MLQHDRFKSIGTRRDDGDRRADQHLKSTQVGLRRLRQVFKRLYADGAFLPARMLFVDRLANRERFGADRKNVTPFAANLVTHRDTHRVETIEHIELRDAQAGHAVDLDDAFRAAPHRTNRSDADDQ